MKQNQPQLVDFARSLRRSTRSPPNADGELTGYTTGMDIEIGMDDELVDAEKEVE